MVAGIGEHRISLRISAECKAALLRARPGYGTIQLCGERMFGALAIRLRDGRGLHAALLDMCHAEEIAGPSGPVGKEKQ